MNLPINPKEVAEAAIRRGALRKEGEPQVLKVKFPHEVGIEAVKVPNVPALPPKPPHKRTPRTSRYVIHQSDLLDRGFTQKQINQLKAR